MQRNENLYPLSHQHHNGLMAVLLLKKGIAKHEDAVVMGTFILSVWENELRTHFLQEEVQLHPDVLQIPALAQLYDQMKTEHHQIRKIIDDLRNGLFSVDTVKEFHQLLEQHIRFEERILFPFIETHVAPEQMIALGKRLEHLESKVCSDYPVRFWE